jgi:hypothetical protein
LGGINDAKWPKHFTECTLMKSLTFNRPCNVKSYNNFIRMAAYLHWLFYSMLLRRACVRACAHVWVRTRAIQRGHSEGERGGGSAREGGREGARERDTLRNRHSNATVFYS